MAGAREIRSKIKSVANTRKVTSALQMVSASKIRRAQELMRTSRPYARHMRNVIAHIAQATPDYRHPALQQREVKCVCYLVVSTDRGLCGGLNANLFRKVLGDIHGWQQKGVDVQIIAIGQKAAQFFRRIKVDLVGTVTHLGDHPRLEKLVGVMKIADDGFMQGKIDRIYLCYNQFVNTMTQRAMVDTLIPIPAVADEIRVAEGDELHPTSSEARVERATTWDYLYEPDAETVIRHLLNRYVEAIVYHATLENLASEHAARMVAMKAASDNATKAIDTLTLIYNKARQAAITQEISEIVGGAAAVGG
ncbi:MAG TPA: F0F1 ATP synthase subunit gamma [Rhodanobacteraceae bacterium]|jgi:F-type H+-transporting ATPase subunit gamma|nr:F0F1 ATP synthase subunit gamma [Rhodanobacteraceae bacterium]